MNFTVNPKLEALIPPLSQDEKSILESLILNDGIQSPLIIARYPDGNGEELLHLADGHNRFRIAQKHYLKFNTIVQDFNSEDDVVIWMVDNQKGRRNLTDFVKMELAEIKAERLRAKGKKLRNDGFKGNQYTSAVLSIIDKTPTEQSHNTRNEIATDLGWSTGKVAMAQKVISKAPEEVKEKLRVGDISINEVYKELKKEEKQTNLENKKEEYIQQYKSEIKIVPEITCIDAVTYLNSFEDNSIDLLITDPPYATDIKDIKSFTKEWIEIALVKVKKEGRIYICSGAYPIELQAFTNVLLNQDKFIVDNPLIWTYRNTLGVTPKMKYNLNYQLIWHLYSNESKELDTSITNEMFSVQDINAPDGRIGNRLHTWQKPDELANRLIRHGSKKGDLVVDCFACTATFLIAAAKFDRIAKGCDISEDNLKIAKQRGCTIIGKTI